MNEPKILHGLDVRPAVSGTGKARFENVDVVRGIAALLVVLQHSVERSGLLPPGSRLFTHWINLGQTGVLAFFLVSGFVIPLSLERIQSITRFAIGRIFRIYPLYLFVLILSCAFIYGAPSVRAVVAQILFASESFHQRNYIPASWTLLIEAVWYVSFAILFSLRLNRSSRWIAKGIFVVMACAAVLTANGSHLPIGHIGMLATCVVGLFAYRYFIGGKVAEMPIAIAVVIIGIIIGLIAGYGVPTAKAPAEFDLRCVLTSWAAGYVIFFSSFFLRAKGIFEDVLRYLGEISYSVYLTHLLTLAGMTKLGLTGWPYVLAVMASAIALSALTFRVIETPFNKAGKGISAQFRVKERASVAPS